MHPTPTSVPITTRSQGGMRPCSIEYLKNRSAASASAIPPRTAAARTPNHRSHSTTPPDAGDAGPTGCGGATGRAGDIGGEGAEDGACAVDGADGRPAQRSDRAPQLLHIALQALDAPCRGATQPGPTHGDD